MSGRFLILLLFFFFQFQGGGVDAVALPCRIWPIVEDVAKVSVASAALNLSSRHALGYVSFRLYRLLVGRGIEAGPSGARVVFGIRTKQRLAAADTFVDPGSVGILVLPGERWFGALLAGHIVL